MAYSKYCDCKLFYWLRIVSLVVPSSLSL